MEKMMTSKRSMVVNLLLMTGCALLLASFLGMVLVVPEGSLGWVMLTPEGCASVRLAGGNPESRDGICVASGRYVRRFSGWTDLTLAPGMTVTLSSRAVLLVTNDDRVPMSIDDIARRRRAFALFGAGLAAAALCLWLAIRIGRPR